MFVPIIVMAEEFKLKKIDGEITVKENKQVTKSPYNSIKNFKYADVPVECNKCPYRDLESGGTGACPQYKLDAFCAIRDDLVGFADQLDTRDPSALRSMMDVLIKKGFVSVMTAYAQAAMSGGIPDRNTRAEVNSLMKMMSTAQEFNDKIILSEKVEMNRETQGIDSIFRQIQMRRRDIDGKTD